MRQKSAPIDRFVAEIAARQHGVATIAQLLAAGLTRDSVKRRVQAGRLHRTHRGVYAVGNPNLTQKGHWMAAVLACGRGAVLSHGSAAKLWSISPTSPSLVHVSIPSRNGRSKRQGIVIHRPADLPRSDTTRRRAIPVTTHARTLRDLGYREPTRSHLERTFLRLLRSHKLPLPEVNARVGPYEVDFLWRRQHLVVEVDGYEFHSSRASFESDRARDRELQRRGYVVLRFTYREVTGDPTTVAASLLAHLRRHRPAA